MDFNHVSLQAKRKKDLLLKKVGQIIDRGVFLNGPELQALEKNLQNFLGTGYVRAVGSGHEALEIAVTTLGLQPGDEVVFPVNAYPTVFPLALQGLHLVPADVDENGQLNLATLNRYVTASTKAIVIVHMYGLVGELERITQFAQERQIYLIEDCAQALGAKFNQQPVGTFGDVACFSFYPTKNYGTLGDGGAIWVRNAKLLTRIDQLRQYGERKRYASEMIAGHSRIPEIQAGILNVYFSELTAQFKQRQTLWSYFRQRIIDQQLTRFIRPLETHPNSQPVPHLFVSAVKKRDQLQKWLTKKGIPSLIHYPTPIHQLPAFQQYPFAQKRFPLSEWLAEDSISLPFHPYMTTAEIDHIIETVKAFYAR